VMTMTFGESPMAGQVPPEACDRIMHVSLDVGGTRLMGSDSQMGSHEAPKGFRSPWFSRIRPKRSASSPRCRRGARWEWHSSRRSGQNGSGCSPTGSGRRG
jgi:hypothetical protein